MMKFYKLLDQYSNHKKLVPIIFELTISMLIINIIVSSNALTNEDYTTLVDLYNSTGGNNWINKWNLYNSDYCQYYGVYCDYSDNSYIIQIKLDNNNLSGTLPRSINNLRNLNYLVLNNNKIYGDISFLNIQKLFYLDMSNNKLSGDYIPNLLNLKYLILNNNSISSIYSFNNDNIYNFIDISNNNLNNVNINNKYKYDLIINSKESTSINCYNCMLDFSDCNNKISNILIQESNCTNIKSSDINSISINNQKIGKKLNMINSTAKSLSIYNVELSSIKNSNINGINTINNIANSLMRLNIEETITDTILLSGIPNNASYNNGVWSYTYSYSSIIFDWILINTNINLVRNVQSLLINNSDINTINFQGALMSINIEKTIIRNIFFENIRTDHFYVTYIKIINSIIPNEFATEICKNSNIITLIMSNSNITAEANFLSNCVQQSSCQHASYNSNCARFIDYSNNNIHGIIPSNLKSNLCINLQNNNVIINSNKFLTINIEDYAFTSSKCYYLLYNSINKNTIIAKNNDGSVVLI